MNEVLKKLNTKKVLKNKEFFTFISLIYELINDFWEKLSDGEDPDENPDILLVRSSDKSVLGTAMSDAKNNLMHLKNALNLPQKHVETQAIIKLTKLSLLDFGLIRKAINTAYQNNENNKDAESLWFLIRIYKGMAKNKSVEIHANLVKFVADLESDKYKSSCAAMKLTDLIQTLKEKNQLYEQLILKRSEIVNINSVPVTPFRVICDKDYENVFKLVTAIIALDPITDYSEFISKMNGYTEYYQNMIAVKRTRSITKNKKEDKPSENPDILITQKE